MKNLTWRMGIVGAVIVAALIYLLPTFIPGMWPNTTINLGLDLQGGMHLVLEVDTDKAVESTIERMAEDFRQQMQSDEIAFTRINTAPKNRFVVTLPPAAADAFDRMLDDAFPEVKLFSKRTEGDEVKVELGMTDTDIERTKEMATAQALETIRNRIDQFGVSEPDIRIQGEKRILIQLPGVDDPERAKDLIGRTAQLEFKLLDESKDPQEYVNRTPPPGTELLYEVERDETTNRDVRIPYLVKKRTLLTGQYLTDARVQIDPQYNEPYVSIEFNSKGARIFERITGENVRKRLAIVLDERVYSAPTIQEKIGGGEARITGNFNTESARDLAIVLRAGALPAPVNILEERTVGPSLGSDSIRMGITSMVVGGLLVVIFMVVYYNTAGLVADLALLLNVLLIAAGLAAFQATLTLPGIAGIILTIGMAVDANVLIFERIREEMSLGKTLSASVNAGYERATLTILDANVTTLIAALVLFQFGTGPVKGFAVTLSLGVISSLFTALFVTRVVFDLMLFKVRVKKLAF